jgi:hypothetical protein
VACLRTDRCMSGEAGQWDGTGPSRGRHR